MGEDRDGIFRKCGEKRRRGDVRRGGEPGARVPSFREMRRRLAVFATSTAAPARSRTEILPILMNVSLRKSLNVLFGCGNGGNDTSDEVRDEAWVMLRGWAWLRTGNVTAGPVYSQLISIESGV